MWDAAATALLGMNAAEFNNLSQSRWKSAALFILDKPMSVKMYIANKTTMFPSFTIKEACLVQE